MNSIGVWGHSFDQNHSFWSRDFFKEGRQTKLFNHIYYHIKFFKFLFQVIRYKYIIISFAVLQEMQWRMWRWEQELRQVGEQGDFYHIKHFFSSVWVSVSENSNHFVCTTVRDNVHWNPTRATASLGSTPTTWSWDARRHANCAKGESESRFHAYAVWISLVNW